MPDMPIGARGTFTLVVAPDHLANRFKDAMLPPVLATPVMIMIMENAALNAMKPYLAAGESALGTRVDIRHLAATPVGRSVTGEAEIVKVDGRRLEFTIRALDGAEVIGTGTHERIIIDLAAFLRAAEIEDALAKTVAAARASDDRASERVRAASGIPARSARRVPAHRPAARETRARPDVPAAPSARRSRSVLPAAAMNPRPYCRATVSIATPQSARSCATAAATALCDFVCTP